MATSSNIDNTFNIPNTIHNLCNLNEPPSEKAILHVTKILNRAYIPFETISNKSTFNKCLQNLALSSDKFALPTYPEVLFSDSNNSFFGKIQKNQEKSPIFNTNFDTEVSHNSPSTYDPRKNDYEFTDDRNLRFLNCESPNGKLEYLHHKELKNNKVLYDTGSSNLPKVYTHTHEEPSYLFNLQNHREIDLFKQSTCFIGLVAALENSFKLISHHLASFELFMRTISTTKLDMTINPEYKIFMSFINSFIESVINTFLSYKNKFCNNNTHEQKLIPFGSENYDETQLKKNETLKNDFIATPDSLSTSATSFTSSPILNNLDLSLSNTRPENLKILDTNPQSFMCEKMTTPTFKSCFIFNDNFSYEFPRASLFEKTSQLKFLASANVVGRLFDYNGEHIRKVQNQFRVKISTSGNRIFYPGTGKQVLFFKGQLLDIMYSVRTIFTMMIPDILDLTQRIESFNIDALKYEMSIVIPSTTSNKILSSKGAFIQKIQQFTSARIHVTCMRFEMGEIQERIATITGLRPEVEKTVEAIALIIQEDPNKRNYSFLDYPLYTKAHKN